MAAEQQFRKTPEEFVNEIKTIMSANVSKSAQLMARANNLIRSTIQAIPSQGQKPMDESEVLERWLNLNIASYTVVSDHALSMLDKLITVTEGAVSGETQEKVSVEDVVDIHMSERQGKKCSAGFLIQNHYDHVLAVSFEATPLVADGAATLTGTLVSFDPSSTILKEGEEKTIKVMIDIGKEFVPGKTYVANIHVLGYEAKKLVLSIEVLPPATSKPRSKRTKTRRAKTGAKRKKTKS